VNAKIKMQKLISIFLLAMAPVLSWSQTEIASKPPPSRGTNPSISTQDLAKLSNEIITKIQAGEVLDLLVRIEHADIFEKEKVKKESRRLVHVDRQLIEETKLIWTREKTRFSSTAL
jgi:hypothetical protein